MKAWTIVGTRAFLLLTALACGLVLTGCVTSGIKVLVVNKAGGPLRDMKVSYTGGSMTIGQLDTGGEYRKTIALTAASDVDVEFTLPSGEKKTRSLPVQLEPGYVGDLRLEITPEGRIGWEKQLEHKGRRYPKESAAKETVKETSKENH